MIISLIVMLGWMAATVVEATVPLSEMFGYAGQLRGLPQGGATFSMHYLRYEAVAIVLPPPDNFPPTIGLRA